MTYKEWKTPENLLRLTAWARDGLTISDIAHNMGIAESTFYVWQNEYPEFKEAIKEGKDVVDIKVENATFKKCIGYVVKLNKPIKTKESWYDENGKKHEKEEIKIVQEEQYIPPDTTAQIFWLKNRRPDRWRDRQIIDAHIKEDDNIKMMQEFLEMIKDG